MTDINKQIEEEAKNIEYQQEIDLHKNEYEGRVGYESAQDLLESLSLKIDAYKKGYQSALSSSRWRKVSEELPESDQVVLVKMGRDYTDDYLYDIAKYDYEDKEFYSRASIGDSIYEICYEVIEWKPID